MRVGISLRPRPRSLGGRVRDIAVDPANLNNVYVIDDNNGVFQTTDGGMTTWTDITGNITSDGAGNFRSIVYIQGTMDRIAVGTNAGVFVSIAGSFGTWLQLGGGLPNAPVWDLDYDAPDDVLVAGTLGRGAWTIAEVSTLDVPVGDDDDDDSSDDSSRTTSFEPGQGSPTVTNPICARMLSGMRNDLGHSWQGSAGLVR